MFASLREIFQECRKAGIQEKETFVGLAREFVSWFPAFLHSSSVTWEAVTNTAGAIGASEDRARLDVVEIDSRNLRTVRRFEPFAMQIGAHVRETYRPIEAIQSKWRHVYLAVFAGF